LSKGKSAVAGGALAAAAAVAGVLVGEAAGVCEGTGDEASVASRVSAVAAPARRFTRCDIVLFRSVR
jgi:hypothetical protein